MAFLPPHAPGNPSGRDGLSLGLLLGLLLWAGAASVQAGTAGSNGVLPYPEAVRRSRLAAEAVLARGGAETCLRGKITRALLGLSASCEALGERNALCALADKAVVVTPMSLTFMDETAHQLLELSNPATAATSGAGAMPTAAGGR
ncbi:MAG: hypothetical protein ACK55H_11070 [Cyanobacteriota bacterium]|jgi:hypothetical protein